jgi:KDO2-lipid IV(A) lauroyltransferase
MSFAFRAEYVAASVLLALLRALKPATASNLGGYVARSVGPLLPASRVAHANLRAAMPELDAAARRRIVRGVWDNLGRTVAELPHLSSLERDTPSGPGWVMCDGGVMAELAQLGGPVVFCSAHLGNWEFLPAAAAACGTPIAGFYRAAANPLVDAMIRRLRASSVEDGLPFFAKGAAGARRAMAHISRGGRLGLLVDQKLNDGIEASLFALPAMTAAAPAALALRARCPVVCAHVERLGPARLRVVVEAPLPLPDSGDREADIAELTQRINDVLERWIRARPESWLWVHRRWPKDVVATRQRKKAVLFKKSNHVEPTSAK